MFEKTIGLGKKELLKKKELEKKPLSKILLFHVGITTHGLETWRLQNKLAAEQSFRRGFEVIDSIIEMQLKHKIRIITIYILAEKKQSLKQSPEEFDVLMKVIQESIDKLAHSDKIHQNQIKISILGKWFDLPAEATETIRNVIDETKDYDNFFLNFCINYNGQEELVEACRLIARKVKADKLDPELITKSTIKESLYSYNFLPPDIIIKNGRGRSLNAFMLWDSSFSHIYFTGKNFPEFNELDLLNAIEDWKKS